jgi:predicted helicase
LTLNLHGKSRIGEPLPSGVDKDENVFEITQGVVIGLFVRRAGHTGPGQVFYADLWGRQNDKYNYLTSHDVTTTKWISIQPDAPFYFFFERDLPDLADEYRTWSSAADILVVGSMGVVTGQDNRAYAFDETTLCNRFGGSVDVTNFKSAAYRPFDKRKIAYDASVVTRRREDVMQHLFRHNLALVTFRHTRRPTPMRVFAARHVVDARLLSSESNCYAFPLYRYTDQPDANGQMVLDMSGGVGREPNLNARLLPALASQYEMDVTPEEVFYYLYGVLNAPGYQQEFEALLQVDFPRIPFTADYEAFCQMAERGQRLIQLHLLEAPDLQGMANLTVGYPVAGDDQVERGYPQYNPTEGRVHINPTQYFEGITQAMWDYKVGSYNPLEKWLKDRRGRTLSADDRRHYETFATAISKVVEELPQVEAAWQLIRDGNWFDPLA